MENTQTLKDALIATGNEAEVALLSHEAQNLTKAQIIKILNNDPHDELSVGTANSLKTYVFTRLKKSQSIFPWKTMPGVKTDGGGLEGGWW